MKKAFLLSMVMIATAIVSCNNASTVNQDAKSSDTSATAKQGAVQNFNLDTNTLASGAVFYQCPMHPEVLSDKVGQCPKCEMDLEEMKKH